MSLISGDFLATSGERCLKTATISVSEHFLGLRGMDGGRDSAMLRHILDYWKQGTKQGPHQQCPEMPRTTPSTTLAHVASTPAVKCKTSAQWGSLWCRPICQLGSRCKLHGLGEEEKQCPVLCFKPSSHAAHHRAHFVVEHLIEMNQATLSTLRFFSSLLCVLRDQLSQARHVLSIFLTLLFPLVVAAVKISATL